MDDPSSDICMAHKSMKLQNKHPISHILEPNQVLPRLALYAAQRKSQYEYSAFIFSPLQIFSVFTFLSHLNITNYEPLILT